MIDPQARPASYIKLLALVVVLGVISALVTTFVFIASRSTRARYLLLGTRPPRRWVWMRASLPSWSAPSAACWSGCW